RQYLAELEGRFGMLWVARQKRPERNRCRDSVAIGEIDASLALQTLDAIASREEEHQYRSQQQQRLAGDPPANGRSNQHHFFALDVLSWKRRRAALQVPRQSCHGLPGGAYPAQFTGHLPCWSGNCLSDPEQINHGVAMKVLSVEKSKLLAEQNGWS